VRGLKRIEKGIKEEIVGVAGSYGDHGRSLEMQQLNNRLKLK